jgi:hypothetical protein
MAQRGRGVVRMIDEGTVCIQHHYHRTNHSWTVYWPYAQQGPAVVDSSDNDGDADHAAHRWTVQRLSTQHGGGMHDDVNLCITLVDFGDVSVHLGDVVRSGAGWLLIFTY